MPKHMFFDYIGDDAAVTKLASAGNQKLAFGTLATCRSVASPLIFFAGHPTMLAICRCNPNSSGDAIMMDEQRPFSSELLNVFVVNGSSLQGVYHYKVSLGKNNFWSDPKKISKQSNKRCHDNVEKYVTDSSIVENGLGQVQGVQNYSNRRPSEIAVGSKNSFCSHRLPIIPDRSKPEEGIS
jgi:hypothetical protein